MISEEAPGGEHYLYGVVRTSSWELDGCGGRTDVHDLFAVFWAAVLRANGVASAQLVDMAGWNGLSELESRIVLLGRRAPTPSLTFSNAEMQRIEAHTAWAWHALDDVFSWQDSLTGQGDWSDEEPLCIPKTLSELMP